MQVHQTDFSTGSVRKNILDVALPMTAAQLLNLLYNIVDRVYIGMIPDVGQVALGGLGLCFPIIMMVTAFTNLFGGASPLCGIARGAGNEKEAENIMGNAFVLLAGASFLIHLPFRATAPDAPSAPAQAAGPQPTGHPRPFRRHWHSHRF